MIIPVTENITLREILKCGHRLSLFARKLIPKLGRSKRHDLQDIAARQRTYRIRGTRLKTY